MSSVSGATVRMPADQLSYFARTLAGTRLARGVVQKPWPRSQRPVSTAKPRPSLGAMVAEASVSPRSSTSRLAFVRPRSRAPALSSSIVPATAPAPNAPEPPPRVTRTRDRRSGASALNGMVPKNGSAIGTPSSRTRLRLVALPPSARNVTPCAEGLDERLSDRRNCWNPATPASTSSIRPDAARNSASRSISVTS